MLGFSNSQVLKLIQRLPIVKACTKFTNWLDKSPVQATTTTAILPADYKPVTVLWKHLDCCTVCYLEEESTFLFLKKSP
ncbi:unnamed protein product [Sphagnum jensenii]|uniref:Uncharacterized protein n=1 Tax=Sphagnum jensenii TaxID=128206 RepID=A0ABP0VT62_9BRYO